MTGDENPRLLREIEANRAFLLTARRQNPALPVVRAVPRIRDSLRELSALPGNPRHRLTRHERATNGIVHGTIHHLPR